MIIRIRRWQIFLALFTLLCVTVGLGVVTKAITVSGSVQDPAATPLPIVMYHHLTKDPKKVGSYVLPVAQFEQDLAYLKEKGYSSITVAQLLAHVYAGAELPENPVIITVDDSFESIYTYAYPLLQQYDMRIVLAVIGSATDLFSETEDHNLAYSHLTWAQAKEMADSGYAELQSHTYDLHTNDRGRKGASKKKGESLEAYREFLMRDLQKMQDQTYKETSYTPTALAYPFGAWSPECIAILEELGFQAAFICEEKINYIDLEDTDWLFRLKRYNRFPGKSSEVFFKKMGIG